MLVKDLVKNASCTVEFVIVNCTGAHDLPFGIDGFERDCGATCHDAITIEHKYPHVLEGEIKNWHVSKNGVVWIFATVPKQDLSDVINEFMDYLDSLGMGALS